MKKTVRILFVLIAVLFVGWFCVRRYLNSRHVVAKVVAHLQQAYGGNVKLDEVDIGLTSSELNRLEFSETDCAGADSKTPWLTIESFAADVSIFDLLKQQAVPTQVKVKGAKLFLRFSKDGKLLTCLPEQLSLNRLESGAPIPKIGAFPLIELEDAQVQLHTEGSPDLVLKKVSAKLENKKGQLILSGSMENPEWGKWTMHGQFEQDSHELPVVFGETGSVPITPAMMQQLPFVPLSAWQQRGGSTPFLLRVTYDLNQGKFFFTR